MLYLIAARRNRAAARRQHPERPTAFVDRERRLVLDLAVGSEQFHREQLDLHVQLGAAEFHHRALRPRRHPLESPGKLTVTGVAECGCLAGELGDFLAHAAVVPGRRAIARQGLRELCEIADLRHAAAIAAAARALA